jgi:hypothetical protein
MHFIPSALRWESARVQGIFHKALHIVFGGIEQKDVIVALCTAVAARMVSTVFRQAAPFDLGEE